MVLLYKPVYLIIEGRVNCLGERSLCFKTYNKGSYFGDIEIFSKGPRLFSVRAEYSTTLAIVNVPCLMSAFKVYRESKVHIMQRSIERLLKANIAMQRIKTFNKVIRSDPFWSVQKKGHDYLHYQIQDWLEHFWISNPDDLLS